MTLLRTQQAALTRIFPHNANRRFVIPSRRLGPQIVSVSFKVTQATIEFDRDVSGGDATGWSVEINGVPEAVIDVLNGAPTDLVITYALQVVTDTCRVVYDGSGDWADKDGAKLQRLDESGVIT